MAARERSALAYTLIRDLPSGERPRERLRDYGPGALSTPELLAIVLRTGAGGESVLSLAARLLAQYGDLVGLARATHAELCSERGLGPAKAAQLQAALELGKRLASAHPEERPVVRSPADVAALVATEMGLLEQEDLRVVVLNTRNQVLTVAPVYRGSVNSALVRPGEVLREAVRRNATAIIILHNHPSGDPTPSAEDVEMTERIVEAGRLLDVEVLDHLIIGHQRWVSLKQLGRMA